MADNVFDYMTNNNDNWECKVLYILKEVSLDRLSVLYSKDKGDLENDCCNENWDFLKEFKKEYITNDVNDIVFFDLLFDCDNPEKRKFCVYLLNKIDMFQDDSLIENCFESINKINLHQFKKDKLKDFLIKEDKRILGYISDKSEEGVTSPSDGSIFVGKKYKPLLDQAKEIACLLSV